METQGEKRIAEIGLLTSSKPLQKCARVQLFRDSNGHTLWPSECDDYAFCKVCGNSFSIARGGGNDVVSHGPHESRAHRHRAIEQTVKTNSSIRQFFAAPSKTADSKQ